MNGQHTKTILLVEDEVITALAESETIMSFGYNVLVANSGKEAAELAGSNPEIHLVLMDIDLGKGMDGTGAARLILAQRQLPIVFLTSHSEREMVEKVRGITRYGYVTKYSGDFVLQVSIEMAFELFEAHRRIEENMAALRANEEKYRSLFDNSEIGMFRTRIDGSEILDLNEKFLTMFGNTREETLGAPSADFYADVRQREEMMRILERDGKVADFAAGLLNHQGEIRYCLCSAKMYRETGIVEGSVLDITEQKRAQEALKISEERFRRVFDQSPIGVVLVGADFRFRRCNESFCRFLGYTEDELQEKTFLDVTYPDDSQLGLKEIQAINDGTLDVWSMEKRYVHKSGALVWGDITIRILEDLSGGPKLFVTIIQDITGKKKVEKALLENEERFRHISNTITDLTYSCKRMGASPLAVDWITGAAEKITGYSIDEIQAKRCWSFMVLDEDQHLFDEHIGNLLPGSSGFTELRLRSKDGDLVWVESYSESVIRPEEPDVIVVYGGLVDITERKEHEMHLKESEEKFSAAFHLSPVPMALTSMRDGMFRDVNSIFLSNTGYSREEVVGRTVEDLGLYAHVEDRDRIVGEVIKWGKVYGMSMTARTKSGELLDCMTSVTIISIAGEKYLLSAIIDVTEYKHAEDALKQKIDEMERFHNLMVDRELRMIELKQEINRLRQKMGEPIAYPSEGFNENTPAH
jgi:PAS domain S-box-containing protein